MKKSHGPFSLVQERRSVENWPTTLSNHKSNHFIHCSPVFILQFSGNLRVQPCWRTLKPKRRISNQKLQNTETPDRSRKQKTKREYGKETLDSVSALVHRHCRIKFVWHVTVGPHTRHQIDPPPKQPDTLSRNAKSGTCTFHIIRWPEDALIKLPKPRQWAASDFYHLYQQYLQCLNRWWCWNQARVSWESEHDWGRRVRHLGLQHHNISIFIPFSKIVK